MDISRRQFLIGGAAFASLGAFAGNRFILAAAGFKAGGKPRLKFGVLSDIHILRIGADEKMSGGGNNLTFKHALEWFRSQDVDAVVIAGKTDTDCVLTIDDGTKIELAADGTFTYEFKLSDGENVINFSYNVCSITRFHVI